MAKKKILPPKTLPVVSNIVFLVPWVFAISAGDAVLSLLIPALFAVSSIYHVSKPYGYDRGSSSKKNEAQSTLLYLDTILASIAGLYTFYLFFEKGLPPVFWYLLPLATFSVYAFHFWRDKYYAQGHTFWHIVAALVMTIALI